MKNVIKKYSELAVNIQQNLTKAIDRGDVEKISFPYKGEITSGLVYIEDDVKYLVVMDIKKSVPAEEEIIEDGVFDDFETEEEEEEEEIADEVDDADDADDFEDD